MGQKSFLIDSLQATAGNCKNASDRCDVDQYLKGHISIKPGPSHTLVIHHGKFYGSGEDAAVNGRRLAGRIHIFPEDK